MSILTLYQFALILAIAGTFLAAQMAKRQLLSRAISLDPDPSERFERRPFAGAVRDKICALDKLFDENVISVDEYVELRRRATH